MNQSLYVVAIVSLSEEVSFLISVKKSKNRKRMFHLKPLPAPRSASVHAHPLALHAPAPLGLYSAIPKGKELSGTQ